MAHHIHRNWYGKKIAWILNEICPTGRKIEYTSTGTDKWIKDEKLYQCPVCKRVEAIY